MQVDNFLFFILLTGSADFYGLNHYTTRLLTPRDENSPKLPGLSFGQEIFGVVEEIDKKWMRWVALLSDVSFISHVFMVPQVLFVQTLLNILIIIIITIFIRFVEMLI